MLVVVEVLVMVLCESHERPTLDMVQQKLDDCLWGSLVDRASLIVTHGL